MPARQRSKIYKSENGIFKKNQGAFYRARICCRATAATTPNRLTVRPEAAPTGTSPVGEGGVKEPLGAVPTGPVPEGVDGPSPGCETLHEEWSSLAGGWGTLTGGRVTVVVIDAEAVTVTVTSSVT